MPLACVILAAGEGTRMRSDVPKPLHEVAGRPMIDHVLRTIGELGPERCIVVVGVGAERVVEAISGRADTCEQPEQRGTGHAAICAQPALEGFEGEVLITYADIPLVKSETLRALVAHHRAEGAAATVLTTEMDDPTGYGRIVRDASGAVSGIVEHADASDEQLAIREINTGIYVFEAGALSAALGQITPDNEQGELYLTDALGALVAYGRRVSALATADASEVMGINDRVQLAEAERVARDRIREELMLAGVTLVDPPSTFIDAGVSVGRDTVIGPGCHLLGETTVGCGCEIRGQVTLRSATIGDGVLVRDHTVIDESEVGDGSQVGPFSLLRGNSTVGAGCKVGSSAEMNRSHLGDKSKMQHFSYLGDSTVGEDCNIGAGAITCNYDGFDKHQTTIEDGVFIGSDTILIAPVTVGEGAYTAAGSVITKDVPPGSLAIERADQRTIEGWAERRRRRREGREQQ
ncbi:MAG: bifunctional UDP-N-acetylglucosamine diphosphorylase/glucosamine-1-phosphate N-acetyltransferase GlmU [Armatimonadota bacterium]|nr:bifunctional UDP-N-acetylglucosamine diphosphorylase/glucosamine-1-phosphate N-acetyltransferase GlmU [Armatimonadota bacterium]